jgi:PhzF family phenazine biosynthesis protein
MPFAGHPTLGTAHVVRALQTQPNDAITLEMQAGIIPVQARGDLWALTANKATLREIAIPMAELAAALGLDVADIVAQPGARRPLWINTGSDQLIVPLVTTAAVDRVAPDATRLARLRSAQGRQLAYVFAEAGDGDVLARFMFEQDGAFIEDPATGSACANLGGWYLATGAAAPLVRRVHQGERVKRPSELLLSIDAKSAVRVGGQVVALGGGDIEL